MIYQISWLLSGLGLNIEVFSIGKFDFEYLAMEAFDDGGLYILAYS